MTPSPESSARRPGKVAHGRKHAKSAVTALRSISETVAGVLVAVLGTFTFVVLQNVLIGWWMWQNVTSISAWDPYPFILLNLMLSLQAAQTGPIVLIASRRTERIADRLLHTINSHATETHKAIRRVELAHTEQAARLEAMGVKVEGIEASLTKLIALATDKDAKEGV